MFCNNCGAELKENAKFCPKCGIEIKQTDIAKVSSETKSNSEIDEGKKKNTLSSINLFLLGIIGVGIIVFIVLMCLREKKTNGSIEELENDTKYEEVVDNEDDLNIMGPINKVGNTYANLGYQCGFLTHTTLSSTGRITSQGDLVYFYEQGAIYELDKTGKKREICRVVDASSLNIIGNMLYYLQGNGIYCVNINSGEIMEVVKNVYGPFIVCNNFIYYVTSSNSTATIYEYYINRYYLNEARPQDSISVGDKLPILAGVNVENSDIVTYYYRTENYDHPNYKALVYAQYVVHETNFNGGGISRNYVAPVNGNDAYCFVMHADDYIYISQYVYDPYSYKYPFSLNMFSKSDDTEANFIENVDIGNIRNCYNNDLIVSDWTDGKQGLYIIPYEDIGHYREGESIIKKNLIIEEKETIYEVYVVGEYLYYTMNSYNEASVYRVKLDGSGWEDI